MTDKQYQLSVKLNEDRPLRNKLIAKRLQLEEYGCKVDVGATNYESDGSTPQKNGNSIERKFLNYIEDVEDLKTEINELTEKLSIGIKWKRQLIDNLEDSKLYTIASMLFISYMTHEKIAEVAGYETPKTIQRKKRIILELLENVLECPLDNVI